MLRCGTFYLYMRVPVFQVFITQVITTDKTGLTIDDQQFAMVAKIDLKTVTSSFCGFKTGE